MVVQLLGAGALQGGMAGGPIQFGLVGQGAKGSGGLPGQISLDFGRWPDPLQGRLEMDIAGVQLGGLSQLDGQITGPSSLSLSLCVCVSLVSVQAFRMAVETFW